MELKNLKQFYAGKRILLTGHTGFKGSWLCKILCDMGASVYGYALAPEKLSLYNMLTLSNRIHSCLADIADSDKFEEFYVEANPDVVFHLAAQPLVRLSYEEPALTYRTNVMGTVNLFDAVRKHPGVKSILNVTTDKVYLNREWEWGYRENERLDGFDPYSNSKSCSELVTWTFVRSFFNEENAPAISTARAGNVIGGGDFSRDRIIPDCVNAAVAGNDIIVRNPYSTRPYQHVLEPLFAYLLIVARQYDEKKLCSAYNIGPDDCDCFSTGDLVNMFVKEWGGNLKWINKCVDGPHEAKFLKLDNSKVKQTMSWHPVWHLSTAISKVVEWSKEWSAGNDIEKTMANQINEYLRDSEE